jgi:hypothetical protein
MASAVPAMTVLPQFQGNAYQLQQQQALAQALMQQSFQPQNTQAVGSGQYSVVPKYSAVGGLAQLGQALIAAKMQQHVAQGYNDLGQNQMSYLMGGAPQQAAASQAAAPQQATDAGGMTDNQSGPGVTSTPVPTPGQPTPQAYASALGATGSGAGTPQQAAAPQAASPAQGGGMLSPGSALNPSGMDAGKAAYLYMTMGPAEYAKNFVAPYVKPTDATLMANQGHVDPIAANQNALFKSNYVAPNQYGPNMVVQDPKTGAMSSTPAAAPAGSQNVMGADGKFYTVPVQGGTAAIQADAAAKASGEGSQLPYDKGVDASGNPLPVMSRTQAATGNLPLPLRNNNPGAVSPGGSVAQYPDMQTGLAAMDKNLASYAGKPDAGTLGGVITKWVGSPANAPAYIKDVTSRLGIPANAPVDLTNPAQRQAISTAIMLHENGPSAVFSGKQGAGTPPSGSGAPAAGGAVYAAPPMGAQVNAEKGAGNLQDELSKKFTTLSAANSEAQNTTSYLQNIKDLAARAAVGPQSDRLNYVNGLLSQAGSEKATDAVTANDLLNKYSGQIIARLSANGMGTDAARSILQSAYPSAHMNQPAINEAADNLIGAQQMTQAKARLLTPLANARNPTDYNNAEMKFDQNADPRIFQYANIQDPTQRQAFAQKLIKQDPKIVQKIKNLEAMGAMQ